MSDQSDMLEILLAGARLNPEKSVAHPQEYYGDPAKHIKLRCEQSCGNCVYSRPGKAGEFCGRGEQYGTRCLLFKEKRGKHGLLDIFRKRKALSPLRQEQENLRKAMGRTWIHLAELDENFWRGGGVCCPGCGVPGYRELEEMQNRRLKRLEEIEEKLANH